VKSGEQNAGLFDVGLGRMKSPEREVQSLTPALWLNMTIEEYKKEPYFYSPPGSDFVGHIYWLFKL
jgi:hypothetical protein